MSRKLEDLRKNKKGAADYKAQARKNDINKKNENEALPPQRQAGEALTNPLLNGQVSPLIGPAGQSGEAQGATEGPLDEVVQTNSLTQQAAMMQGMSMQEAQSVFTGLADIAGNNYISNLVTMVNRKNKPNNNVTTKEEEEEEEGLTTTPESKKDE